VAWDGREHPEWLTGTSPLHLHLYDTIAAVLAERSRITQLMINCVLVHTVDMCVDGPWTHYRNIIGRPQCSEAFLEHYGRIRARSLSTDYIKQIRFKAGRHCNTQQVNKLPNRLVSTRVRLPRLGIHGYLDHTAAPTESLSYDPEKAPDPPHYNVQLNSAAPDPRA
jgi:hypothetical protein